MITKDLDVSRAAHAAYMREYNKRPVAHEKKQACDRQYRQHNLVKLRTYDAERRQRPERKAALLASQRRCREHNREEFKRYHHAYYLANREHLKLLAAERRVRLGPEWSKLQQKYLSLIHI